MVVGREPGVDSPGSRPTFGSSLLWSSYSQFLDDGLGFPFDQLCRLGLTQ